MTAKVYRPTEDELQHEHEELMQACKERLKLRLELRELGYEPIPTDGKIPHIDGWADGEMDAGRIRHLTFEHQDHTNTGLRTGRLVGVDVDIIDTEHA